MIVRGSEVLIFLFLCKRAELGLAGEVVSFGWKSSGRRFTHRLPFNLLLRRVKE